MKADPPEGGADLAAQWGQFWQQNLEAWSAGAAPIAKATAEQFFAVQESAMRFLTFSARAWEALAPGIESGEALRSALEAQRDRALQDWTAFPTEFAEAAGDIGRLWQLYLEQWQQFGNPWAAAFQATPEYFLRAASGDSSALTGLSDLYRESYQNTLGRLVSSPNLGPTRELNEKILRSFDAWFDWQTAVLEYQSVVLEAAQQSMGYFIEQLVALAEKGEQITSVRELTLLWTRGAEEVFTQAFRTEKYVLAQGRMLNAAMQYRIQQRAILEIILKAYDLPTRGELDEAHRRIYQLRKEVKALKVELAALQSAAAQQQIAAAQPAGPAHSQGAAPRRKARAGKAQGEGG